MSDAGKKRVKLAFMLMMHTKNRTIQMITRLSDPVNGLEIWRRYLEEWEPVNRGRHRAMLMQLLQCPPTGLEWERPVRQYEAQNLDTLRDTIKAATLAHNPQDSEWCRYVRLSATSLQGYDALKSVCGKRKASAKVKSKEKARISRRKEHQTRRTRNAPKGLSQVPVMAS